MSVAGNKQSRRDRERDCRRAREEQEKGASSQRPKLVTGRDVPEGKSYMWDTTPDPKLAPGPVPRRLPPKARRYNVPEPGMSGAVFRQLLRKRRAAEAEAGVGIGRTGDSEGLVQQVREIVATGASMANGHASPSGNGHGEGTENGHADPMDLDRTKSMELEMIELQDAVEAVDKVCESLEAEKAEQQRRHDQLKKELTALRSRRTKRMAEQETKEKAITERRRVREEARLKAKQRGEERERRRAEREKVLEKHEEEKKTKESRLLQARQEMEKRQQRFSSLQAELERMTADKHNLVMQLKQVINTEDEARRRDENEARRREILQQAAVAASTAATPRPRFSSGGTPDEQLEEGEVAPALGQADISTPPAGPLPGPPPPAAGSGLASPRGFSIGPPASLRLPPHLAAAVARSPSSGRSRVQQRAPVPAPAAGLPGFLPPHLNASGSEPGRAGPPAKGMSPVLPGGRTWPAPPHRGGAAISFISKSPRAGSGGFSWGPQQGQTPGGPAGPGPFSTPGTPSSSASADPNAQAQQRRPQP